jgi:hypothetical protein
VRESEMHRRTPDGYALKVYKATFIWCLNRKKIELSGNETPPTYYTLILLKIVIIGIGF